MIVDLPDQVKVQFFTYYQLNLPNHFDDTETLDADLRYSIVGASNIEVDLNGSIATISALSTWFGE